MDKTLVQAWIHVRIDRSHGVGTRRDLAINHIPAGTRRAGGHPQ